MNIHRAWWYASPRRALQRRARRRLILALFVVVITGGYGAIALQDGTDVPSDIASPPVHVSVAMPVKPTPALPLSITGIVARGATS